MVGSQWCSHGCRLCSSLHWTSHQGGAADTDDIPHIPCECPLLVTAAQVQQAESGVDCTVGTSMRCHATDGGYIWQSYNISAMLLLNSVTHLVGVGLKPGHAALLLLLGSSCSQSTTTDAQPMLAASTTNMRWSPCII